MTEQQSQKEVNKSVIQGSKILVIDDHKNIRLALKMTLEAEGATVQEAEGYERGMEILGNYSNDLTHHGFDAILLDIRMPDGNGLDLLKALSDQNQADRVIMISGEGTVQDAFKATQLGAFDYVEKPFNPERIIVCTSRCIGFFKMKAQNEHLEEKLRKGNEILGESPAIAELLTKIERVAPTNGRVLIVGQSGTGKELVAKEIHRLSNRSEQELVRVNCAAIPASLIESELFGHEKGSFTGAHKDRRGVFERADGGTLFLDEIGELELGVQAKLLRALQNGEIVRVGAENPIMVDVRLVAATNRDLEEMVEAGTFREDLFYRLNVITLKVPPLKDRGDDIRLIAENFLQLACEEHSLGERSFSNQAIAQVMAYHWPGNVRQLKNLVERVAILSETNEIAQIDFEDSVPPVSSEADAPAPAVSDAPVATTQDGVFSYSCGRSAWQEFHENAGREYIKYILRQAKGNVSEASRILCLERAYLHRLMRKLGVQRDVVVSDN